MSISVGEILLNLWNKSGFAALSMGFMDGGWQNLVMIAIACVLLYLAIVKKFEPLLLTGIAFGCLLSNLPMGGLYHQELWTKFMAHEIGYGTILLEGGLLVDALDDEDFYSGCYGAADINFFPYNNSGAMGISCGLNNVLKLEDGPKLSGTDLSADAAFGDLA